MDIRSWEHVKESADAAGVSTENGTIQVLRFSNSLMSEDFKLLELPSAVLESFQNGERYVDGMGWIVSTFPCCLFAFLFNL